MSGYGVVIRTKCYCMHDVGAICSSARYDLLVDHDAFLQERSQLRRIVRIR